MNITSTDLAKLIREIEVEDPIDYGDLPYDEDELRLLVCNHICEIAGQSAQLDTESQQTMLLAVAAKLVLENLVLNIKLLQAQGKAPTEIGEAFFRRLRGQSG